jgi:hypothetical protein
MYIHPDLGLRLAQGKIEEALSRVQRAPALRDAFVDRRTSAVTGGTCRDRAAAPMLATISRWRTQPEAEDPAFRRAADNEGLRSRPPSRVSSP